MEVKHAYFFKSFAHESRNEILGLLAQNGEMTVEAISKKMEIKASTVSRHLGILKMQGVVGMRVEAPSHFYFLQGEEIKQKFDNFLKFLAIN